MSARPGEVQCAFFGVHKFQGSLKGLTQYFCNAGSGTTSATVKNNLVLLHRDTADTSFILRSGDMAVSNNYVYAPGRTEVCEQPDGSGACADPKLANTTDGSDSTFMMPLADGLAVDAAEEVPVSNDFHGTARPQGDAPDVGAVERTE